MSTLTVSTQMKNRMMTPRAAIDAMLVFVPLAIAGERLGFGPVALFVMAALSCVPLSYWLGQATEALGDRLGPVSGGLLNATFGNAAELIISVFAISQGLFVVVRTSLVGSVLGQLLLVLGTSLLLAGMKHGKLRFSQSLAQVNFTLMAIALVALGLQPLDMLEVEFHVGVVQAQQQTVLKLVQKLVGEGRVAGQCVEARSGRQVAAQVWILAK